MAQSIRNIIMKEDRKMEKIIEIIKTIKPVANLDENTSLIQDKVIDSLSMIRLVAELEDEFDVEISARDIVPENFENVQVIHNLIERLEDED